MCLKKMVYPNKNLKIKWLQIMNMCESAMQLPQNLIFLESTQPGIFLHGHPTEVMWYE